MSKKFIICPRCKEFLGDVSDLDECPICRYELKSNNNIDNLDIEDAN